LYKCLDYEKQASGWLLSCFEFISETCIMDQALGLAGRKRGIMSIAWAFLGIDRSSGGWKASHHFRLLVL
jgi:hypothetical protein